jgi:two-component system, NarL family, nitrate/nitrite response regulator NarL
VVVVPAAGNSLNGRHEIESESISALIIDRQPLFQAALANLLQAPPLCAHVFATARSDEGLELVRSGAASLVFCELRAEPIAGIELVRILAEELPTVRVILLGEEDSDDAQFTAALPTAAAGMFTKSAGLDEFLVGVNAVIAGHRSIGASLMTAVVQRIGNSQVHDTRRVASRLSPTELEILTMVGQAHSIPTIAASRGISNKTVRNHLAKIYRKLELHGRTEAMLWAARMGLTST